MGSTVMETIDGIGLAYITILMIAVALGTYAWISASRIAARADAITGPVASPAAAMRGGRSSSTAEELRRAARERGGASDVWSNDLKVELDVAPRMYGPARPGAAAGSAAARSRLAAPRDKLP